MTDQNTDEDSPTLVLDFHGKSFPVAPGLRRENRAIFAAFLHADRLKDDLAFYAGLARMCSSDEGMNALGSEQSPVFPPGLGRILRVLSGPMRLSFPV